MLYIAVFNTAIFNTRYTKLFYNVCQINSINAGKDSEKTSKSAKMIKNNTVTSP